jgi:shikimate dehydrogenase
MHKAALAHFGMQGDYKLFDIEPKELARELKALHDEQGLVGFNVTIPHKLDVFKLCQEMSEEAESVGAVNTVSFLDDGGMRGHNTDLLGFESALDAMVPAKVDHSACVLGAGGAAKAAILALTRRRVNTIQVIARNPDKAAEVLKSMSQLATWGGRINVIASDKASTVCGAHLIVNTLPIGQSISDIPQWIETLLDGCQSTKPFVYDMVYSRTGKPTALVERAQARALNACDGAQMLIRQAAFAFQFWTGKMPPFGLMQTAFEDQQTINLHS